MSEIGDMVTRLGEFISPPDPPMSDFLTYTDPVLAVKAERAMKILWFWRVKMSILVAVLFVSMAIALTPAGFVRASGLDAKISEAVQPIKNEQIQINEKLATISGQSAQMQSALNELLAASVANNICRNIRRMVNVTEYDERRAIREDVDTLQRRYSGLMGQMYPEERCKE